MIPAAGRGDRGGASGPARGRTGTGAWSVLATGSALLAAGLVLLPACERIPTEVEVGRPTGDALATITQSDLRRRVGILAHDSLRGRGTPSPGYEAAATYVARVFSEIGLEPAGDGLAGSLRGAGGGGRARTLDGAGTSLDGGGAEAYLQRFILFGDPELESANILGLLPGSDPALANRYVLVSAHVDGLGIRLPPIGGDSIYNGADDNASGTAALLELAEAVVELDPAPRRTLLFAGFGAEELGLRGSRWFTEAPTVPLDRIDAVVNLDMIGRNWRDTLAVVPSVAALLAAADSAARRHPDLGLSVVGDPWPEENLLRRSDQWPFVAAGIPGMLVTSGLHADYHRPSDEADRLDYEKTARVTRWLLHLALDLADRDAPIPPAP